MMTKDEVLDDTLVQDKDYLTNGALTKSGESSASSSSLTDEPKAKPSKECKKSQPKQPLPRELVEGMSGLSISPRDKSGTRMRSHSGNDIPNSSKKEKKKVRAQSGTSASSKEAEPVLLVKEVKGKNRPVAESVDYLNRINQRGKAISTYQQNASAAVDSKSDQHFMVQSLQANPMSRSKDYDRKRTLTVVIDGYSLPVQGNNYLHECAYKGDIQAFRTTVRYLRLNGMQSLLNDCNELHQTPLFIFVMRGDIEGFTIALTAGADPNVKGYKVRLRTEAERNACDPDTLFARTLEKSALSLIVFESSLDFLREFITRCAANKKYPLQLDQPDEPGDRYDSGLPTTAKIVLSEKTDLIPKLETLVQAGADPFAKFYTKVFRPGTAMALALMSPRRTAFAKAMINTLRNNNRAKEWANFDSLVCVQFQTEFKEGFHLDIAQYGFRQEFATDEQTRVETETLLADLSNKLGAHTVYQHASSFCGEDPFSPKSLSSDDSTEGSLFSPRSSYVSGQQYAQTPKTPQTLMGSPQQSADPIVIVPSPEEAMYRHSTCSPPFLAPTPMMPPPGVVAVPSAQASQPPARMVANVPRETQQVAAVPTFERQRNCEIVSLDLCDPGMQELLEVSEQMLKDEMGENRGISIEDGEYGLALLDGKSEEILREPPQQN